MKTQGAWIRLLRIRNGLAVAALAASAVLPGVASAVTVDINSVTGAWVYAAPWAGGTISGLNTNEIRWGIPVAGGQSGYLFDGVAPPTVLGLPLEVQFDLGTFTHFNFPIAPGTSIDIAALKVTTNLTVQDGGSRAVEIDSYFRFDHDETTNAAPCKYPGSASVCDDLVKVTFIDPVSESFTIGHTQYFVDITGFFANGSQASAFLTAEGLANTATLRGIVTSTPGIPPAQVPAPLSLVLIGTGVAALAVMSRRR
jgi:hypothetical protein